MFWSTIIIFSLINDKRLISISFASVAADELSSCQIITSIEWGVAAK